VTFGASLLAASINAFFGLIVAWILVRYSFPGKRAIDALVDLPFALPTAVAGITLATLYAGNGWIGRTSSRWASRSPLPRWGIVVALTFIGLPFVVRTLQPVIEDIEPEVEEAAASLGASRCRPSSASSCRRSCRRS
jgi:sulfate transport system permease protein